MRKWRFIFCAALCLCLAACGERLTLPDYTPLDELPDYYTLSAALQDHCVVFDGIQLLQGMHEWNTFLRLVSRREPAHIRLAHAGDRLYGRERTCAVVDLAYDGTMFAVSGETSAAPRYPYLNHYDRMLPDGRVADYYILTNKADATLQGLDSLMASSLPRKEDMEVTQYRVFVNHIT